MTWYDILKLYLEVVKKEKGVTPRIFVSSDMSAIDELFEGGYWTQYDRAYNRRFGSLLLERMVGGTSYLGMQVGLRRCLTDFLRSKKPFLAIDWKYEALQDILTNDRASNEEFKSEEERSLYLKYRDSVQTDIDGQPRKIKQIII